MHTGRMSVSRKFVQAEHIYRTIDCQGLQFDNATSISLFKEMQSYL